MSLLRGAKQLRLYLELRVSRELVWYLLESSWEFFQTTHPCPPHQCKEQGLSGSCWYKQILRPVLDSLQFGETQEIFFFFFPQRLSPALLSLGAREKKKFQRSKIKILVSYNAAGVTVRWQENVNYVGEGESDGHTDKLLQVGAPELQVSGRKPSTHPAQAFCCLHVLKAKLYFGFWDEKLH